jgi:GT2 family glycosyltransferase
VGPAVKRDLAAKTALGEFLVFIDDDSYPDQEFLFSLDQAFTNSEVIAVGGPGITPETDGFWEKVSGATFESRLLSSDPKRYLSVGPSVLVDDWPSVNLSIRTNVFRQINGYSSTYWPGEDTEFCLKLKRNGFSIRYDPHVIVYHHRRPGLLAHLKQVGGYGLHRGFFARKHPENSRKLKYFIPSIFSLYLLSLLVIAPFSQSLLVLLPLCVYAILLLVFFIETSLRRNFLIALSAIYFLFLTHIWYGLNFLKGFSFTQNLQSKLR